jgi:hypothetical protein
MNVVVVADDGVPDLVVGRDDGFVLNFAFGFTCHRHLPLIHFCARVLPLLIPISTLEIFGFEMGDPVPHQHFVRELGESITAIDRSLLAPRVTMMCYQSLTSVMLP